MRELSLLDTLSLCLLLVFSVILPLMLSFRPPFDTRHRKACLKIVWLGQLWLALAGIAIYASAATAPYATVLGASGYLLCVRTLLQRLHSGEING